MDKSKHGAGNSEVQGVGRVGDTPGQVVPYRVLLLINTRARTAPLGEAYRYRFDRSLSRIASYSTNYGSFGRLAPRKIPQ